MLHDTDLSSNDVTHAWMHSRGKNMRRDFGIIKIADYGYAKYLKELWNSNSFGGTVV